MAWLKGLLLAAIVFAAGMAIYFYHQFNLPNNCREETMIMIDKGAGSRQVAKKLTEAGRPASARRAAASAPRP